MSLLKSKKSDRAAVSLVPPWHPNFRNFERLPDVKVVRTSFFINAVAIVITLGLLSYQILQEYKVHEIGVQIADLQHQIDANTKASDQAVQLFKKFQGEEAKTAEVAAFVKTDFVLSNFILDLGRTLPKTITLDYIDAHENGVSLRGTIQGTPDQASGEASAYIQQLKADAHIGSRFESISLTGLNRGTQGGTGLTFELFLKAKGAPKS
ncbi:MAG TPA: hypothetical protein VFB27_07305 [Opitutaceae bacterium]|nr:hypothetical protein [Opitutaceae bacterium]